VASETESFIKSEPEPFSYFEPETVYEEPMNDIYESLLTGTFDDEGDGDGDVDGDGDGEPDVDAVVRPAPKTRKRRHLDEDDDPDFVREGNAKNDEKLVLNAAVRVVKLLAICHYHLWKYTSEGMSFKSCTIHCPTTTWLCWNALTKFTSNK